MVAISPKALQQRKGLFSWSEQMIDEEELIMLKRWVKKSSYDRPQQQAEDYGMSLKEYMPRIYRIIRSLISEYEVLRNQRIDKD